jgi:ribonuclease HI
MELTAALEAVRDNPGDIVIVSDSTYVVNCFRDRWHTGWLKRGWRNSKNEPVANRDLWEPLIQLVLARPKIEFRWVKGHSGHVMNDKVDELAVLAGKEQRALRG